MYITHDCKSTWRHLQQEDKGKLCIVIHAKINHIPIYQNKPICLKQMLNYGFTKDYGLGVNFATFPKN